MIALLSTVQGLPAEERVAAERALVPLARRAALGVLASDVAHDAANALFGLTGLLELAAPDEPAGAERLQLLRTSAAELDDVFRPLLRFARAGDDGSEAADLVTAAREAVALYHHGPRKLLTVAERYPATPVAVACPAPLLTQAAVHLLLAAAPRDRLELEVDAGALRVTPAGVESLDEVVGRRIALDRGGTLERDGRAFVLWLPEAY